MLRLQAFKFELMPNGEQTRKMRRFGGACRFVYNKGLSLQLETRATGGKFIGYFAMAKLLTAWRNGPEIPWLKEAPMHPLQHALKDLEKAYRNFFDGRASVPCFKRKTQGDSFRYPDRNQIKLDHLNGRIFLPKLGWLRYRKSRDVLGDLRNVTVSESNGKWFVSIQTQREVELPPLQESAVGIVKGTDCFATLSDGNSVLQPHQPEKRLRSLAQLQRSLDRKVKSSSNWKKAYARLQKMLTRISNARKDFLHKASTSITKNHSLVCFQSSEAKAQPDGRKSVPEEAEAKRELDIGAFPRGWGEFRRLLEYKLAWRAGHFLAMTHGQEDLTCSSCEQPIKHQQHRTQSLCVTCGCKKNADLVGAISILARGHRVLACGERSS